jgi:7-cyano-7-deazaguanine synthase
MTNPSPNRVGLLLSGGLDSAILLGTLLDEGRQVQPIYVRSHLCWEPAEERAIDGFLAALDSPRLEKLVVLDQSVFDLYGDHWSVTGSQVPDAAAPDESVYLPGRNVLLLTKAGLWCQLHGIKQLALAVLGSNPFPDATDDFFRSMEQSLLLATGKRLTVLRPFAHLEKRQVLRLGIRLPLALTFSCIDPRGDLHCGACNKCNERMHSFATAGMTDATRYADGQRQQEIELTINEGAPLSSPPKRITS